MRIMVADDDSPTLTSLARWLLGWGYEPVPIEDGVHAWRDLRNDDAPPIVILDWDLPGLGGLEVCRMLRQSAHGGRVYVIMMAKRDQRVDLVEALEAGADDFIWKPIHGRELQLRVAKAVALREGKPRGRFASIPPSSKMTQDTPPPSVAPTSTSGNGTLLGGRYRLERKMAEGEAATVWLATHAGLGINVAVKFMKAEFAEALDYARFEHDARAAAQLRSEHIVRVYGHGSHEGFPFLVQEYLGGESLAARIQDRGPMSELEVLGLVEQVSLGLDSAHARGVAHRDVRPENIVLVDDPERPEGFTAKLIDFGFVKAALTPAEIEIETSAPGAPSYTSPECLRGDAEPGPLLDLWGLAATAFVARTGARPFSGDTHAQTFARVCVDPLPLPSHLNANVGTGFDAWFTRACARDPRNRFQTAAEFATALRAARTIPSVAVSRPVSAGPSAKGATSPPSSRAPIPAGAAPNKDTA